VVEVEAAAADDVLVDVPADAFGRLDAAAVAALLRHHGLAGVDDGLLDRLHD